MARKVNKKFVMILVAGLVCVAVVAGSGLLYYYHTHNAHHRLAIARDFAKRGDYAEATPFYFMAASKLNDPSIWVEVGDNCSKLIYSDDQSFGSMRGAYDAALSVDPGYLPALQRKLDYLVQGMKNLPDFHVPAVYDSVNDIAQKILKIDPSNKQAALAIPVAVIDGMQHNLVTDPVKINTAIKQLQDQQKVDPNNADIPYYIGIAYEGLATRAGREGQNADSDKYNTQALATIDPAVKAHDDSPAFHYRAAQVYIGQIQPGKTEAQNKTNADRAVAEITRAGDLVKPSDPLFADIKMFQGFLYQHDAGHKLLDVVKVYQDALAAQPESLPIRLKLAELLGDMPERRDEAIDLLKNAPPPTAQQQSGTQGMLQHLLELEKLSAITNLRLDKYFTLKSDSEKQVLLGEIEQDYRKIEVKVPDQPATLRLKAKLELARNEPGEAIVTLDQAIAKSDSRSPMLDELMFLEARACLMTNQPGTAKRNLLQIVSRHPDFVPARLLLAQTQLKEFDFEAAKENVDWLVEKGNQASNPEVVRMQIALFEQEKKPDDAKKIYATLPEQNRAQKLDKATIAVLVGLGDDAKRLLQSVLTADPGDVDAALMLSQYEVRNKDSAGAQAVVNAALKVKPTNPDLLLQRARINGSSPDDIRKIEMQEAANISDPLERELRLFELTSNDKDVNVPLAHLDAAEKISPNDLRVMNIRFDYCLKIHDWAKAANYGDRLGKINADKVNGTLYQWRIAMAQAASETDANKQNSDLGTARELAVKLTHDFPVYAESWVCMGKTMQAMEHYQDAIQSYTEAQKRQPENVDAYQGMIDCYFLLNQPTDAGKVIDQAVLRLPTYPGFKEQQMQYEMRYGDPEKVIADREKMVADAPDVPQNWKALAGAYESVAHLKASTPGKEAEENAWLQKAQNTLAEAAQKFPDDLSFVVEYGMVCVRLKQIDQGEKLWRTALALPQFKDKPQPVALFASYYAGAGKLPEAEKVLRDYLATPAGKNNPDVIWSLSELLIDERKFDDAITAVDMAPNDPRLQTRKADILVTEGKYPDAEKILNNLLKAGKTPELMSSLAYVYLNTNRANDALNLLNQVLTAKPDDPTALYYRALATVATGGKISDAIADLSAVRNRAPGMFNARYLLVNDLLQTGQRDNAIKELEAIVHDDPGQKEARIQLLSLYSQQPNPSWLDAERIARDADAIPQLANDLDILNAESQMWSARGVPQKAIDTVQRALKQQPQNPVLLQTYYNVLLKAERYQQVLDDTDKLTGSAKDQIWVHELRGMAKSKLGDKDGGAAEFTTALNACIKAKNDPYADHIVDQIVEASNVDAALKIVGALPQASEPHWQYVTAKLLLKKNDVAGSRKAIDAAVAGLDKQSDDIKRAVLGFASSIYMQTPDPDNAKARDLLLQLLRLSPDDYRVYNNLACNLAVSPGDSLVYSQKAFDLMKRTGNYDPLVADTYGWNLIQNSATGLDQGINVLLEAWNSKQIVDIAYHLGAAYLKKGNADEASKYLTQAQTLFTAAVQANNMPDMTLQQKIIEAQRQANDKKAKAAAGT